MDPREGRDLVPIEVNSVAHQQAGAPVPTRMVPSTTPTDHDPSVGPTGEASGRGSAVVAMVAAMKEVNLLGGL